MNTKFIVNVNRSLKKAELFIKKHSPEILVTLGIAGGVTSAIMACKATTKASDIMDSAKERIDAVHQCIEDPAYKNEYTPEDCKKDLTIIYAQTGLELAKTYAPSVILGAASAGCVLASVNILNKRTASIAAAYASVDSSFKEYRNRVIDRFGESLDRELRLDIRAEEDEEIVVDESGNETAQKTTVHRAHHDNPHDEFTRCFDVGCRGWDKDPEYNKMHLLNVQALMNRKLQEDGFLFFNDVLEALGFDKCRSGQTHGWVYDPNNQEYANFVDFGIFEDDAEKRNFVNGRERSIWLEFNVDGYIYDLVFRK